MISLGYQLSHCIKKSALCQGFLWSYKQKSPSTVGVRTQLIDGGGSHVSHGSFVCFFCHDFGGSPGALLALFAACAWPFVSRVFTVTATQMDCLVEEPTGSLPEQGHSFWYDRDEQNQPPTQEHQNCSSDATGYPIHQFHHVTPPGLSFIRSKELSICHSETQRVALGSKRRILRSFISFRMRLIISFEDTSKFFAHDFSIRKRHKLM